MIYIFVFSFKIQEEGSCFSKIKLSRYYKLTTKVFTAECEMIYYYALKDVLNTLTSAGVNVYNHSNDENGNVLFKLHTNPHKFFLIKNTGSSL